MERMLDLRTQAGLQVPSCSACLSGRAHLRSGSSFRRLPGSIATCHCGPLASSRLSTATVARIAEGIFFLGMQQRTRLRHIIHVRRRANDRVQKDRFGVHSNMRLQPCSSLGYSGRTKPPTSANPEYSPRIAITQQKRPWLEACCRCRLKFAGPTTERK
jgi:hypothetical protein